MKLTLVCFPCPPGLMNAHWSAGRLNWWLGKTTSAAEPGIRFGRDRRQVGDRWCKPAPPPENSASILGLSIESLLELAFATHS